MTTAAAPRALLSSLLLALTVSAPALAEVPALAADLGYAATVVPAKALDLVAPQDHLGSFHVGAAATLPVSDAQVDIEAAFNSGGSNTTAHGTVATSLWLRGVEVGARYRYPVRRWLEPYLRLSGAYEWGTLTLLNEASLTQTVGNPSGTALVGVQLPVALAKGARAPKLLLDLGVGYTLRPGFRFDALGPAPVKPAPEDPLGRGTVDLGTLPLSGVAYRITVALRY